jgi:hypothetical protein
MDSKGGYAHLAEPISERPFQRDEGACFSTTMPLVFQCHAYTKVGPVAWHTILSPEWFRVVFGDAMALVRRETFMTNLVLEKEVPGLHADGSMHYEHFPFSGTTNTLAKGVHHHNYWAQLYRPFYTSGHVEKVTEREPVIRGMPMTFARQAITFCPERYSERGPTPESVRGTFFGYGQIDPVLLLKNRLAIRTGDFQLCARQNPETGAKANTYFYGTFHGKMSDLDGDGRLDVNTRPVHCDAEGRLDYLGDGQMVKDPVCPLDWP